MLGLTSQNRRFASATCAFTAQAIDADANFFHRLQDGFVWRHGNGLASLRQHHFKTRAVSGHGRGELFPMDVFIAKTGAVTGRYGGVD